MELSSRVHPAESGRTPIPGSPRRDGRHVPSSRLRVADRPEATELVERAFPFTGPLRRHRDAIVLAIRLDPRDVIGGPFASSIPSIEMEYTDEAIRAMYRAERRVIHETNAEIRRRFDSV